MKRRPQLVVALLLGLGILVSAGLSWTRSSLEAPPHVTAALPREGLLFSVAAIDLPARLSELRAFPLYRELFDPSARYVLSRFAGWERELPDPWSRIPYEGPATLGFYRGGWTLAESSVEPAGTGVPDRVRGAFRFVASSPTLLDRATSEEAAAEQEIEAGGVHIAVDPRSVTGARGRAGALLEAILPDHAEGDVRVERASLRERWVVSCVGGCLLEALDPSSNAGNEGAAWSTVSPAAAAVSTFRFVPATLRTVGRNPSGGPLKGLERIESFLDLAVREDLAESLGGSGVAFVHPDASGKPRFTIALDLARPPSARALLDRVTAVGVLSGSASVHPYRGVSVLSWSGRMAGLAPSAAIEGDLLLLASRPTEIEEAIDRLRDGAARSGTEELGRVLSDLSAGPWKGAAGLGGSLPWDLLRPGSKERPSVGNTRTRAVLYRRGERWILEGGGQAPAVLADGLLPALAILASGDAGD